MKQTISTTLPLCATLFLLGACSVFQSDKPAPAAEPAAAASPAEAPAEASAAAPTGVSGGTAPPVRTAASPRVPAPPSSVRYSCAGTRDVLSVVRAANGASARISLGGQSVQANRVRTASGARFTAARADLWERGNTATLTWRGKKYSCKTS